MSFWCLQFLPKNEQKQVNLRYRCSKVEFICSFFGRIHDLTICFRVLLTFTFRPTLISLLADQILGTLNSDSFEKYVHLYNTQNTSYDDTWHLLKTLILCIERKNGVVITLFLWP